MRCPYCSGSVVGDSDIVVLVGEGPAHRKCYERDVLGQRVFRGLHLPTLELNELYELKEMLLTELNAREQSNSEDDGIELFA